MRGFCDPLSVVHFALAAWTGREIVIKLQDATGISPKHEELNQDLLFTGPFGICVKKEFPPVLPCTAGCELSPLKSAILRVGSETELVESGHV